MKVTNWTKKLCAAIVAAGIWVPSLAHAVNIPLGDPSFENYTVPAYASGGNGFAYAQPIYGYTGAYRPPTTGTPSAWIDDLDSPPGYTQDDGNSNWIYELAYGESSTAHRRPAPRTGNQAMHGLENYNAQKTGAVFEANTTYTFSLWAQGDIDGTGSSSRVFLYMFDGTVPFSEANSLIFRRYAPDTGDFVNRGPRMSPAQSATNWTQISLSYDVLPGSPAIGHTVGVAFWIGSDGAVEDASLFSNPTVPEPATMILVGMAGLTLLGIRRRRE
jgi:hypothetical protein